MGEDRKQIPGIETELPASEIDSNADLMIIRDDSSGSDKKVKPGTALGRNVGVGPDDVPKNQDIFSQNEVAVNVPGDYSTLQEAFEGTRRKRLGVNLLIKINIQAGHALTDGVILERGDFSMYRVISEDDNVLLDASFPDEKWIFEFRGVRAPDIRVHFDVNDVLCMGGFYYTENSVGYLYDAGVSGMKSVDHPIGGHAGGGLVVRTGSAVSGSFLVFKRNWRNISVTTGSSASFTSVVIEEAEEENLFISRGSNCYINGLEALDAGAGNLRVLRSNLTVMSRSSRVMIRGAGLGGGEVKYGVQAWQGSVVRLISSPEEDFDLQNSAGPGLVASASVVTAESVKFFNNTNYSVWAERSSQVLLRRGVLGGMSSPEFSLYAERGSVVTCDDMTINEAGAGAFFVKTGASLSIFETTIVNSGAVFSCGEGGGRIEGEGITVNTYSQRLIDQGGAGLYLCVTNLAANAGETSLEWVRVVGGTVVLIDANLMTNVAQSREISVKKGARVTLNGCSLSDFDDLKVVAEGGSSIDLNSVGLGTGTEIDVLNGSLINANGIWGDWTFSQGANSLTSDGIIFHS